MAAEATEAGHTENKGRGEEGNEGTSSAPDHGNDEGKDEGEDGAAKTIQVFTTVPNSLAQSDHFNFSATIEGTRAAGKRKDAA